MSDPPVPKQEINLRTASTKTAVTLYPRKAQIVRDLENITLNSGANEITIYGLCPTVIEGSINVDGHGAATITDIVIESVPNPESFNDVYPDLDLYSDSDDEHSWKDPTPEKEDIKKLKEEITKTQQLIKDQEEIIASSLRSLEILDKLVEGSQLKSIREFGDAVDLYHTRRPDFYVENAEALAEKGRLQNVIGELNKNLEKLQYFQAKEEAGKLKAETKEHKKRKRAKDMRQRDRAARRQDRANFWPKKVYKVVVTLEAGIATPETSRRGSIDSAATVSTFKKPDHKDPFIINLRISYITDGASWSPHYDLHISTPSSSGVITYKALMTNTTSENWKNAKITLSTSQATFSGIDEAIPYITPWNIKLQDKTSGRTIDPPTFSVQERAFSSERLAKQRDALPRTRRADLFGLDQYETAAMDYQMQLALLEQQNKKRLLMARGEQRQEQQQLQQQQQQQQQQVQQHQQILPPRRKQELGSLHLMSGGMERNFNPQSSENAHFASLRPFANTTLQSEVPQFEDAERETLNALAETELDYEESAWEESGLTATYEVPTSRTLAPSWTPRRVKIATIHLHSLELTHIIVPKLRSEAFLRAKVTNTSNISLPRGAAGLHLDGSFLGNTTIPRCSAGETFLLPLGIDPAINVAYSTPTVRKAISNGIFNKEDSTLYTRATILVNTRKTGSPIDIVVRDQVPTSQDERLKVDIEIPKGLNNVGDIVKNTGTEFHSHKIQKVGTSSSSSSSSVRVVPGTSAKDTKWGFATAKLGKSGMVEWTVKLNPGKATRLALEYAIKHPNNEGVIPV
jgi:hypothetical protein